MGNGKPGRRKSSVCEWRSGMDTELGAVGHKQPVGLWETTRVPSLGGGWSRGGGIASCVCRAVRQ